MSTEQVQIESPTITAEQAVANVSALRDKVAAMVPGLVPELLKAGSIDELISSIDESKAVYDRLVAANNQPGTPAPEVTAKPEVTPPPAVPPGGVSYTVDISQLSPGELIRRGLEARSK